jgi:glycosyltransferase involved in cell wall biosynthesis
MLIPARNEATNLRRLLPTLLNQDYPDFEVLVYDDGSEDATWQVVAESRDPRLRGSQGSGPPPGWVGKVHALYRATRGATGDLFLFLDADVALKHPAALSHLVARFQRLRRPAALTGLTHLRGGGHLVVSLVPLVILSLLPLPLVTRLRAKRLSALNGQCWMITQEDYLRWEPHLHHRDEVLEDIQIGRYLKAHGVTPVMADLQDLVAVWMYGSTGEAWRGFRKNVYLFMGATPWSFGLLFAAYLGMLLAPLVASPWFIAGWYGLKALSDRFVRSPARVTVVTPVSLILGAALQLDSAVSHWTGRVRWKGRLVAQRPYSPPA